MIVLLLEKNWGSGSIDKINALTYWLSTYPKDVPCFIFGCESTIPDANIERYHHKERDNAVRALCDEVLLRSKSIGVRGKITHAYLTKMLGYDLDKVDVVYEGPGDGIDKLQKFLKKNGCPAEFERSLFEFQLRPHVVYERPVNFDTTIVISRPYITKNDDKVRLNSDITIDGVKKTLWCETSEIYRQFLLSERVDAFVCALLPFAMRAGKDIRCEAPVSEQFLHNLSEVLIPHLCAHDSRIYRTSIFADCESSTLICGNAVATGMSCGVDSFYTAALYYDSKYPSMNLTHLYCGNYLYGNDGPIYERAQNTARDLGLPLVQTATNINETLRLPHLYTHFFKTMFGVLALRKMFRTYYYSSTEDFSYFDLKENSIKDTAKSELLLLYAFSCSDFQVITGGGRSARLEKTQGIINFSTAHKYLNVCLHPEKEQNCGRCAKCMRTLLMLDMLGALDRFENVFDVNDYRDNRIKSFAYLVEQKKSPMLLETYNYFSKADPLLIQEVEDIVHRRMIT